MELLTDYSRFLLFYFCKNHRFIVQKEGSDQIGIFAMFFLSKDEHKVEHKSILTHVFTRTCEISDGRGNRTQKPKRQSMTPSFCRPGIHDTAK